MNTKTIFFLLLILSATGFISPPIALCAGLIFGLTLVHPYAADSPALSKFLLQASVAALAIHDTSSVVGAATRYGNEALVIATTVKLARALWIVPLALATAAFKRSKSKVQMPWFIVLFCIAAVINTYGPQEPRLSQMFFQLGRLGLTVTLYLIGTGISRATLKEVGWRPLAQGLLLWILVGVTSLYFIHNGWIAL